MAEEVLGKKIGAALGGKKGGELTQTEHPLRGRYLARGFMPIVAFDCPNACSVSLYFADKKWGPRGLSSFLWICS